MGEFYHNLVTEKSFQLLKQLRQKYKFILIGGWAVFILTKTLKSKDIDVVVDFPELEKFRQSYEVSKNERLKRYEAKQDEIDIDIYAYHYSNPGIPAEDIGKQIISRQGFEIPRPEILLILKQQAYSERQGTPKGEKDKIDILSLLKAEEYLDLEFYKQSLKSYGKIDFLRNLIELVSQTAEIPELDLNKHKMARLKKQVLQKLEA